MANYLPRRAGCDRDSRRLQQEDPGYTGPDRGGLPKTPGCLLASDFGEGVHTKRIKKQRLERAGWVVGDSAQFLQLSVEENRFIELKLALATGVRELRERRGLTQAALAHRLGSSQSRVAKMEAADRSVSLDLIMRSLLTIGATAADIAKWIKRAETARAA